MYRTTQARAKRVPIQDQDRDLLRLGTIAGRRLTERLDPRERCS
jgi:hypothetical protein